VKAQSEGNETFHIMEFESKKVSKAFPKKDVKMLRKSPPKCAFDEKL